VNYLNKAAAAVVLLLSTTAQAQVTSLDASRNLVRVAFVGTVTNDVTQSISIRQPDGSLAPYTGPVPDYPYKVGDSVTIGFDVIAPNKNYYASPAYTGQQAADGLYDISLQQINLPFDSTRPLGSVSPVDVSGPIRQDPFPNVVSGVTLKYNANTDSYSVALANTGWRINGMDAPSYVYDPTSGNLTPRGNSCFSTLCEGADVNILGTAGNATVRAGVVPFANASADSLLIGSTAEPGLIGGIFSALNLSGMFNLPIFGSGGSSSGGATDVPEPGTLFLFGGGALALVRRQKRRKAA
jgi:PEP-CTERM motif